jgi:CRP-like cAMP-binding protein
MLDTNARQSMPMQGVQFPAFLSFEADRPQARHRRLPAHRLLFSEGDRRTHLYGVIDGVLCTYKLLADGRRQISAFYFPGEIVGIGVTQRHAVSAESISAATVSSVPLGAVDRLIRSKPEFGSALLELASEELAEASEHLLSVGQRSVGERVANFLLKLADRNARNGGPSATISLPMSRSDIADFLGTRLETVSRCMSRFKWMGLIELPQPNLFRVRDRREEAAGCSEDCCPAHRC